MAQADEAMLRLCRLCVSVKMHTQKKISQRIAQSRHAADPSPARDHAQGQNEVGLGALKN